jgi:hypothetical protein
MQTETTKRFALLMPWGRVGSNLVVSVLNPTAGVKVMNEPTTGIRSRGEAAGLTAQEIDIQQRQHLDDLVANATGKETAIGLKLSYKSLIDQNAYIEKLHQYGFRMVLMVRRNFLKCAVSQQRALVRAAQKKNTDVAWNSPWEVRQNEPKPEATELDIARTIKSARLFEALHWDMLKDVQEKFGDNYTLVEYETLLGAPEETIRSVFHNLELKQPKDVGIRSRKATSDFLQDDILNFEDFTIAVRDEGLGRFL